MFGLSLIMFVVSFPRKFSIPVIYGLPPVFVSTLSDLPLVLVPLKVAGLICEGHLKEDHAIDRFYRDVYDAVDVSVAGWE